jgi:hypothetical protein
MRSLHESVAILTVAIALGAMPAAADPVGVVKESGRTAGHAVRDGALTVGRTTRDFFKHGPRTAGRTWEANADHTSAEAHRDADRVRHEAHDER